MARYIIGIDQSTQGTKALLVDEAGRLIHRADRAHEREIRSRREERMMCSFNGCWRNDACMGYAAIALGRMNFDLETILAVLHEMHFAFDDTSVEEAAEHLTKIGGNS